MIKNRYSKAFIMKPMYTLPENMAYYREPNEHDKRKITPTEKVGKRINGQCTKEIKVSIGKYP